MLRLFALTSSHRPRGRMALSVAGIALGVALGYGVHLVNRAAVSDVAAAVRALAGEADLEVRGARAGFSESLYPRIARLAGVAVASPALELDVGVAGTERTIRVIGLDILRAALLQPQLALEDRLELLSPDKVLLSAAAANALRLAKGDKLSLVVGQRRVALDVAGVLPEAAALGAAGAAAGLVLGYALAAAAVRGAGADLGAGMFRGVFPELEFSLLPAFFYLVAGIVVTIVGAVLPALDAARTAPARALKAGDEQVMFRR